MTEAHPTPTEPEALPISGPELTLMLLRPHLIIHCVLGQPERLARNLSGSVKLGLLIGLLLLTSLAASIPFCVASPYGGHWRVTALFAGSLLICFPSLHVFAAFLGFRLELAQNLTLALILPAAASLFTLSFAPIVWFITFSMRALPDSVVTPTGISLALLILSMLLGIVQMVRCMRLSDDRGLMKDGYPLLICAWLGMLLFVTWRMAWVVKIL